MFISHFFVLHYFLIFCFVGIGAISLSCRSDRLELLKLLLKNGANPNVVDADGLSFPPSLFLYSLFFLTLFLGNSVIKTVIQEGETKILELLPLGLF